MQQISNRIVERIKPAYLWWAIIVLGIVLRVRQYFSGRSFWGDESAVAFNLVQRNFIGLTRPLSYEQGAPVGFLFVEKSLILLLGNIDQVMRLFPLFCGIVSIYLFYRIAQAHIKSGMFATLLFAVSWSFIYYSSELKQYSTDVMVALLLVFLAERCLRQDASSKDFWLLGAAGMGAMWFSHPSVFILAGIGFALFVAAVGKIRPVPIKWLFILAILWAVSFGLDYLVSLRHLAADDYLRGYWNNAFMPLPPNGTRLWFVRTYYSLLTIALNRTDQIIVLLILILVPIGCVSLLYRDRLTAIIVISPFFVALLACAAGKYPLKGRMMLFLVPFLFFLVAEALGFIYSLIARWNKWIAGGVYLYPALILVWLPAAVTWEFFLTPYAGSIKPVMQYVAQHRQAEDHIYVYHTSNSTFEYYAPFYGLEHANVLLGRSQRLKRRALQEFYDDVKSLQGRDRVWFIFTRIADCGGCEGDKQTFYVDYLNKRGTMLDSLETVGGNLYLYDLNP